MEPRVLIATAEDELRASLSALLVNQPIAATTGGPIEVLNALVRRSSLRVMLLSDAGSWDRLALDLLDAALARRAGLKVLFLSARPTVELATDVMRRGAADFIPIPYSDEVVLAEIGSLLQATDLHVHVDRSRRLTPGQGGFERIVSRSPCMQPLFDRAAAVSRNDTPILISGETGTGKELIARAIHASSRRAPRPFVPVNCAALPRDLFEGKLVAQ